MPCDPSANLPASCRSPAQSPLNPSRGSTTMSRTGSHTAMSSTSPGAGSTAVDGAAFGNQELAAGGAEPMGDLASGHDARHRSGTVDPEPRRHRCVLAERDELSGGGHVDLPGAAHLGVEDPVGPPAGVEVQLVDHADVAPAVERAPGPGDRQCGARERLVGSEASVADLGHPAGRAGRGVDGDDRPLATGDEQSFRSDAELVVGRRLRQRRAGRSPPSWPDRSRRPDPPWSRRRAAGRGRSRPRRCHGRW